jgi:hypothetical protein
MTTELTFPDAIYAALSPTLGNKIYPNVAPDGTTTPYAVYGGVGTAPELTLANGIPIDCERIQIDVWGSTYLEARSIAGTIKAALLATPYPIGVILKTETDGYEPDVKLHRVIQEYSFWNPR